MGRRVLKFLGILLLALPACAQDGPADRSPELTLEQAIAEAQQNNRLIKSADQSVLYSNDAILAARTQRTMP